MSKQQLKNRSLEIFEPHFRRNFIHIKDVTEAFLFAIKNFSRLRNNVYNLGLSSANISKINLAKKNKKIVPKTKVIVNKRGHDPDKRDYFVSNKKKLKKKGFKAKISLDDGIRELHGLLNHCKIKFVNNY